MEEKNHIKQFRFALYQEDVLLGEKIFDAEVFNPFTRHQIDIRNILPRAITKFQKLLSRKRYDTEIDVGNDKTYELFKYVKELVDAYPSEYRRGMIYNPKPVKNYIEDKVIRGVECKIGLYIDNNTIVERTFYVDGFNSIVRYSTEVIDGVVEVTDQIANQIKRVDMKNMWDDYDLINKRGLSIQQIREFSASKRAYLLRSI